MFDEPFFVLCCFTEKFDIMKFFLVDIFKRNISYKLGFSGNHQKITVLWICFQYSQKCPGSLTQQIMFYCCLGFYVCLFVSSLFKFINHVCMFFNRQSGIQNICHFIVINAICLTNVIDITFWLKKFHSYVLNNIYPQVQ